MGVEAWRSIQDQNTQNPNAGNGGDLVKHSVYLATIDYLLAHAPWKQNLTIRECHAGRGIYRLGPHHQWRNALAALFGVVEPGSSVLLRDAEHAVLEALECWPQRPQDAQWYAGSALLNAWVLAQHPTGIRGLELYEFEPDTRIALRGVLSASGFGQRVDLNVLPAVEANVPFDGERYVNVSVGTWAKEDLVLLDPFAKWRKPEHQRDRDLYAAIFNGVVTSQTPPSLIVFWTWGSAAVQAKEDLEGSGKDVPNGYQELLRSLKSCGFQIVLVKWHWGYLFAMWIIVPAEHVQPMREHVYGHCSALATHLRRNGQRWAHAEVFVEIV